MNLVQELAQRGLTPLLEEVCRRHHVTQKEISSRTRTRMISLARQELWWMLRHHPDVRFSYVELGKIFSRNHSTILQGVRAWEKIVQRRNHIRPLGEHENDEAPEAEAA